MFDLKKISPEAIPGALSKAERYRLLNDPMEAESICLDVLEVEPDNQDALIILLLALTDQFKRELFPAFTQAKEILGRLSDHYCKEYYSGMICERRAKVHMERGGPGSGHVAHTWLVQAMKHYDRALNSCSPGNQDAVLRWNTCARIIMQHPDVRPAETEEREGLLDAWD
jgi:hypothetical protein